MPKASRLTAAAAASVASLMLLSACGGGSQGEDQAGEESGGSAAESAESEGGGSAPTLAEAKPGDEEKVEDIEVTEAKGEKGPSVELPDTPLTVSQTTRSIVAEGDGKALAEDAFAEVDLAMFSAKDGKAIEGSETYTSSPIVLDLGNAEALPGLVKAIADQPIGSSGVAVLPPKDLFGEQGMPEFGIDGKDNVVLVYDVRGELPTKAEGTEVTPEDEGLPTVEWKADAPADITVPEGEKAPTKLVTEKLIEGDGKTVKKDETVYVSYTGVTWDDGEVFDSSMQDGRGPFAFPVGQNSVIPGWDKAVEGSKVGDRLLVVVPPDEGYGEEGTPDGSIKPDSTLVFVVDVLGAP